MCGSCGGKSSRSIARGKSGKIKKGQKIKGLVKKTKKQLEDEIKNNHERNRQQ